MAKKQYVVVTDKGFITEFGKFVEEYPDAAVFKRLKDAKFIANAAFHLLGISAEVVENYGFKNQKTVYNAPVDME